MCAHVRRRYRIVHVRTSLSPTPKVKTRVVKKEYNNIAPTGDNGLFTFFFFFSGVSFPFYLFIFCSRPCYRLCIFSVVPTRVRYRRTRLSKCYYYFYYRCREPQTRTIVTGLRFSNAWAVIEAISRTVCIGCRRRSSDFAVSDRRPFARQTSSVCSSKY